jgi:hypothetical protein
MSGMTIIDLRTCRPPSSQLPMSNDAALRRVSE